MQELPNNRKKCVKNVYRETNFQCDCYDGAVADACEMSYDQYDYSAFVKSDGPRLYNPDILN